MISILLYVLFAIALCASVGVLIWGVTTVIMDAEEKSTYSTSSGKEKKHKAILISGITSFFVSLGLLITLPGSVHQIDTGTVAVVRHLGKVTGLRQPGTYFDFYMVNSYETYDTKVQQDHIVTAAYSKDGQTMDLEVFLQYQIQSENIMKIATEYGSLDALQSRIETQTIEKTKAVMSSDIAMNIIQDRAEFSNKVSTAVREGISADYYVNVRDVVLTNIDFTDEFERAVEAKVVTEQEKIAAETKAAAEAEVAKIRAEAEKTVAEIEAEKKVIEAEANAEVVRIAAQAEAKATVAKIVELARTVGFNVIETENSYTIEFDAVHTETMFKELVEEYLEYLAYLEQWNGELPEVIAGDDAISIIVPNK